MAGLLPIVSLQNCMRISPIVFVLTLSHTAAISLLKALKNVKKNGHQKIRREEYRYIIFNVMKIKFKNRNAVDIFKIRRKKRLNFEIFFAQVGTDIQLR